MVDELSAHDDAVACIALQHRCRVFFVLVSCVENDFLCSPIHENQRVVFWRLEVGITQVCCTLSRFCACWRFLCGDAKRDDCAFAVRVWALRETRFEPHRIASIEFQSELRAVSIDATGFRLS